MAQTRRDRWCEFYPSMGSSDTLSDNFQGSSHVLYVYHGPRFYLSKLLSECDICHLCQFTPLDARVEIISDTCLQFSSVESKYMYLNQHAHMHMLINAFAIPSAITI